MEQVIKGLVNWWIYNMLFVAAIHHPDAIRLPIQYRRAGDECAGEFSGRYDVLWQHDLLVHVEGSQHHCDVRRHLGRIQAPR